MKTLSSPLLLAFLLTWACASAAQIIDINTAPVEELVKIIHIGEARAKELISLRPFYSIDELAKIKGIGPARLKDIKDEGLAWVDPNLQPAPQPEPELESEQPAAPAAMTQTPPAAVEPEPEAEGFTEVIERGVAAVAEPVSGVGFDGQNKKPFSIFIIALALAIISGVVILTLKNKLKRV